MTAEPGPLPTGQAAPALPAAPLHLEQFLEALVAPRAVVTPREAWLVFGAALLLGVWGDALFYNAEVGLNLPLWAGSVVAAIILVGWRLRRMPARAQLMILTLGVALASVFAWRDSELLYGFGTLAILSALFLGVALPAGTQLRRISPITCAIALASGLVSLASALLRLPLRLSWGRVRTTRTAEVLPVVRAVLIATPLLLVFGALFFAADAVFADRVDAIFDFDISAFTHHARVFGFSLFFAASMLWAALAVERPRDATLALPARFALRRLEMAIVLGSLALLFGVFVLVQVRYLFGGEELVQRTIDLTYAEYARKGFFELVTASLLLLPVLAGIEWARQRTSEAHRAFLVLAGVLGALLLVIMASAWQRLDMYVDAFGLTQQRYFAAWVLPWVLLTLCWFMVCAVRERAGEFMAGAIFLGAAALLAQYVIAPDAFIARTNVARATVEQPFDAVYASSLSADAVPVLLAHLDAVPAAECEAFAANMRRHLERYEGGDWRSWNWSRERAQTLLQRGPGLERCG